MPWSPILNAHESPPGTWRMLGPLGNPYATITFVRRGPELGYRVSLMDGSTHGYYTSLTAACKAAHTWFTSTRGPSGVPYIGWVGKQQE